MASMAAGVAMSLSAPWKSCGSQSQIKTAHGGMAIAAASSGQATNRSSRR
jgi:hypothetical protein